MLTPHRSCPTGQHPPSIPPAMQVSPAGQHLPGMFGQGTVELISVDERLQGIRELILPYPGSMHCCVCLLKSVPSVKPRVPMMGMEMLFRYASDSEVIRVPRGWFVKSDPVLRHAGKSKEHARTTIVFIFAVVVTARLVSLLISLPSCGLLLSFHEAHRAR